MFVAAAPALALTDTINGDEIEWDINVGGLVSCSSGMSHCYQSPVISASGSYSLSLTLPRSAFENLQSGGYIWLSVHSDPGNTYEKNYRYRTEIRDVDGEQTLVYYLLEYWAGQTPSGEVGPIEVPDDGVDVSYQASYALHPLYFGMMDYWYQRDGAGAGATVMVELSPSSRHWIGNAPWQEGEPGENPDTEYEDEEGPGQCAVGGQGLPRYAVNTSTRGLVISDLLFTAPSPGPDMTLALTYSPVPTRSGMFGPGWAFSLDAAVTANCSSATLRKGTHQTVSFTGTLCPVEDLEFPVVLTPPTGNFDKLVRVAEGFEYTPKGTRQTYRFTTQAADGSWLLQSIVDANGNALTIARDADDAMASVTDAAGRTATFAYNEAKRVTAIQTPGGTQASFVYASGNLSRVTDLAGVVTEYAYDASNYLVSMTAGGKTTQFVYDAVDKGALATLTDAEGNVVTYARDASTNAVTRTDAKTQATVFKNASGRTTQVTDPLSRVTSTTYYANGLPKRLTEPGNVLTDYVYDARGNLTSLTRFSGGLSQVWSMTYDADDNLLTMTDPLNKTRTYTYDAAGNLLTATTPTGLRTVMTYDAKGQPLTMTLPGNRVWNMAYDSQGNQTGLTNPLTRVTTYGYDAVGNRTLVRDPRGNETRFEYDANRRRTRTVWPGGASRRTAYGCCAPETVTDERGGVTSYAYDDLLRLTSMTRPGGGTTHYVSDANGNLTVVTDALGHARTMTYDADDRLATATDPLGDDVAFSYNVLGKATTFIDQRDYWTYLDYDTLGRAIGRRDPLDNAVSLTLDAAGNVTRATNARGGTVDFTFDDDGRATSKTYGETEVASFAYHAQTGDLASFSSASHGTVAYARDALGRVTRIDYPDGKSASFTYDAAGNMDTVTYPGNLTATLAYTSRDRVSALAVGAATMSFGYDAAGNLTSETRSNGANSAYGYDADQRLISVTHGPSGTPFVQRDYTRDATGKVTGETGFQPREPWQETSSLAGNFDAADRQTYFGAENMTTDNDGNVTAISGSRNISISYDPENRPTSITSSGVVTTYLYDALGNRVRRTRGGVVTNYHYDHLGRLLYETDGAGAVTMLYVHAGKRLVASGTQAGGFRFYHIDKTGNTLALSDATGAVVAAYAYDPYGKVLSRTGSGDTAFTFVGAFGVMDEGDGLFFMRNRYYDAVTGRFLQKDPIGLAGGFNLYRYVENNPISRIDPFGLQFTDEEFAGFHEYPDADNLIPDEGTKKRVQSIVDDATTSADLALSAQPGVPGRLYTSVKCLYIMASGGGVQKPGVADDVLWELGKMLLGLPGTILDFFDADNATNVKRAQETEDAFKKKFPKASNGWRAP